MIETIVAFSDATADEALKAARSLRGFPVCAHRSHDSGLVMVCIKARGHDDGVHPSTAPPTP